ncbi:MAG: hypothetical protein KIT84_32620 [Labilithrix sp.]|nr:hypothetical protein [Labilithrix sp.]MCW5815819.1 hypothetical protein [Labilithrix sp.]
MPVTEAEVKRLLADAVGKRLHATRLASLEKLRGHLAKPLKAGAVTAAIDGLLAIAVDTKQPRDVRLRAADVLGGAIAIEALRDRFHAWSPEWTPRLRAIGRDVEAPEAARLLALRAVEARVLEEEGLADAATDLFIEVLSRATDPVSLRHVALVALSEIHRGTPSFFADERRIGGLATAPLPRWEEWEALSPAERDLAAALADPAALAVALDASPAALEAVELHVGRDPSSARMLVEQLRPLVGRPDGAIVEPVHARLLRAAVDFDRAHADLSLEWVAPAIALAAALAGRRALAIAGDASFEEHVRLWSDLFRDGGRGLADRLFEKLRVARALDDDVAAAWVALHALGDDRASARGLALARKKRDPKLALGFDALVAAVAPEVVLDLQEEGLLTAVDVPTEDERARLYRDDTGQLARRVRLAHVAGVLASEDAARIGVVLDLLPAVVRWLPPELARFEPLLRALFAQKRRARPAFEALVRVLEELAGVAPGRRRSALAYLAGAAVEIARQVSAHGLGAAPFARSLGRLLGDAPAARAFWLALVTRRDLAVEVRLDAWRAIDALTWDAKDEELGELLEDLLTRADEPEIGAFLVEPFRRRWPVRFATVATRLRVPVPPIERVSPETREALAAAVPADDVIARIEGGAPLPELLGAMLLVRGVVARRPDLRPRARAALAKRIDDTRVYDASIPTADGAPAPGTLSIAAVAFGEHLALGSGDDPSDAAKTLARVLAALEAPADEELARATELARRFAASATSPMLAAAVTELERDLAARLARPTADIDALEAIAGAYCEAIALLGDARGLTARLERTMRDRTANAGARYAAFAVLSAAKDVDRDAVTDDAVARFLDRGEDPALRALLGGVVTIARPSAFASIVDMNLQPWSVLRPDDAALPANSLPANMPMTWLVATLTCAAHVAPVRRAAAEIATRLAPANRALSPWEWTKVRAFWMNLVKGGEADARRGLRVAAATDVNAASLLALFGEEEDAELLARAVGLAWTEQPLADTVFWRPAGKAPAFGRYSQLEPWLEASFGTPGRYRILSDAYVHEAERAEGGDASRYAYEAFLLAPDNPRATEAMTRFGG